MGIWQKLGIVIPPLSGDSNSGLFGGTSNQDAMYDTNPLLISANPDGKVMKMWFMGKNDLWYAESNDGITFTRAGAAQLLLTGQPKVFKNAGTYYLYATTGEPTQGTQGITTFTSTDGATWASQGVGLAVGGVGHFDAGGVWYLKPFVNISGTWYATYSNTPGPGSGIATSTDLIHWTNAASGLSVFLGGPSPATIGGVYYVWTAVGTGQGSNAQIGRSSSRDMVNWTTPFATIPETQTNEGAPGGVISSASEGCGVPTVLAGPGGKSFCYYSGTAVGNGSAYRIMGAVTPYTPAQIVQTTEGIVTPTIQMNAASFTDNMQRANETPLSDGGQWSIAASPSVQSNLVSNQAVATNVNFGSVMALTGQSWQPAQWAESKIGTMDANAQVGSACQIQSTVFYSAIAFTSGTAMNLGSLYPGGTVGELLQNLTGLSFAVGDTIRLFVGNSVLAVFRNGVLLTIAYDSQYRSGGVPGFKVFDSVTTANAAISSWSGGGGTISFPFPPPPASGDLGPGYDLRFRL